MKKIPVILDVDTGIDDAIAIMMAIKSESLDIKLICSCSGNTTAKNSAINTLKILNFLKEYTIPVVEGSEEGFVRTRKNRFVAHGNNGLGDYDLPIGTEKIVNKNAKDYYAETILSSKEKMTIIVLGPMTNLARVLAKYPEVKGKIKEVLFMGSSLKKYQNNELPYAGFNVACDPEAFEKVLASGLEIVLCPTEIGRQCYLTQEDLAKLANLNATGKMITDILKGYRDNFVLDGASMYDSTTMLYLLLPESVETNPVNIEVRYYNELDTAVALADFERKPNAKMVTKINAKDFKKYCYNLLKKA